MPCNTPLSGWRKFNAKGITFRYQEAIPTMPVDVPCGQCWGCRLDKSKNWAVRIMNEVRMNEISCFVTLTYDNENLPKNGTLVKEDLQKFWKDLRYRVFPEKIRYFASGEYGDKTNRPHYHAIIFGYYPGDAKLHAKTETGNIYQSEKLTKIWNKGHVGICQVSFELAQYTAKYVMKKLNGERANEYGERIPEFGTMSRRPGIGTTYYQKYKEEITNNDSIITEKGVKFRPPTYYMNKLKDEDEDLYEKIKIKRLEKCQEVDYYRNWQKEKFAIAKNSFFKKVYKENKI